MSSTFSPTAPRSPRQIPKRLHAERATAPTAVLYDMLSDGLAHTAAELLSVVSAAFPAEQAYEEGIRSSYHQDSFAARYARERGAKALAQNRLYILRRDNHAAHDKITNQYVMAPAARAEWLAHRAVHPK